MSFWQRPAAVAGRFYPSDRQDLLSALNELCPPDRSALRPYALMVPHAGYVYSGRTAGDAYQITEIPNEVFVLCPNHTGRGARIAVWSQGEWETPIGSVPIAEERARKFLVRCSVAKPDTEAHRYEHAIEVHLPFLLHRNPEVKIVPIVLGALTWEDCRKVGEAVAELSENSLVLASTDMSHYISAREAKRLDELALVQVDRVDGEGLYNVVVREDISMCGFVPTAAVLTAAKHAGVKRGERLGYSTSGDVTGDQESVVAYAAARFCLS